MAIEPAAISASPAITTTWVPVTATAPVRPAARANGTVRPSEAATVKRSNDSNAAHWANFIECVKTRQRPICDIEIGVRSSAMCLLANVALRSGLRVDWDDANWTTLQPEARPFLPREYRAPWKLEI